MFIDAHQHLWQIGQNGHEWPTPDLSLIHQDFLPEDLMTATQGLGIAGTVLVQSQPSALDTAWLLEIAAATPLIKAVVGWTDMTAPDAADRIATLTGKPKLKGLRPMLQGLEDDWILRADAQASVQAMVSHNLTFDALVFTRHLPAIDALAKRYPHLRIIIDHGAKPAIASGDTALWFERIAAVAQNDNVACKLSGLLTEAAPGQLPDDLTPYADHLLSVFGPDRLMWGSDWPVVRLNSDYRQWFDWTKRWLADKPDSTHNAIMGETARNLYNLN
jgi:L-fuconolactonase